MTVRPLVSIITGTIPSRLDLVLETMAHIREQIHPNLEHCIAVEGEPDAVDATVARIEAAAAATPVPTRVVGLGRWWSRFLSDSYAAAPFIVGQFMARGEYACLWADDERALCPRHIEKMVALIEEEGTDFVFPTVDFWWHNRPNEHLYIGSDPPQLGSITHWLYRPSMVEKARGPYRTHVGRANDWEFIDRAMRGGATWAWLPEVTFSHRADD